MRASLRGVLELLEHDHGGALAEHEAVAIPVKGPARALGILVALAHRAERAVAGEPIGVTEASVPPASATSQKPSRIAWRACSIAFMPDEQASDTASWGPEAVTDGDARGRCVREEAVVEGRRQLLADHALGASIRRRLPDPRTSRGPSSWSRCRRRRAPVDRFQVEVGVADGLDRRTERQLHVAVGSSSSVKPNAAGSKPRTSQAIWDVYWLMSNFVMRSAPEMPLTQLSQ